MKLLLLAVVLGVAGCGVKNLVKPLETEQSAEARLEQYAQSQKISWTLEDDTTEHMRRCYVLRGPWGNGVGCIWQDNEEKKDDFGDAVDRAIHNYAKKDTTIHVYRKGGVQ